jgi:hypothetical protein
MDSPYTFFMRGEVSNAVFILPNAKRLLVEPSGVRITDKKGNTVLEYPRKEVWFELSLDEADRRLLSELKIGRSR